MKMTKILIYAILLILFFYKKSNKSYFAPKKFYLLFLGVFLKEKTSLSRLIYFADMVALLIGFEFF